MMYFIIIHFTKLCCAFNTRAMSKVSAAVSAPNLLHAAQRERHGPMLMVAGGLLLGTIGVFVEEAGQDPLTTVWFRCAFGAGALLAWGLTTGQCTQLRLHGYGWVAAAATGCLMVLNWVLFFGAIARTSIGVATVVFHIQPLLVMALGAWWLRERVSRLQWAMGLLALVGLALSTGLFDSLQPKLGVSEEYLLGLLMCLGGSLSYAGVTLVAKSTRSISPFALAWWQCVVGAVLLAWWPMLHGWPQTALPWVWLSGLGIIHTGLAYVLLYAGMARLPAGRIAMLQFVYPAAAVLVDWAVYGRTLSATQLLGVSLMAVAIGVARKPR
jgi:drug/metabolite transporter (DMT)-like permease